jgi:hypothetical protein
VPGAIASLGRWAEQPEQAGDDPRNRIDQPFTLEGHISGSFTDEMSFSSGTNWVIRPQPNEMYHITRINVRAYDLAFNDGDAYGSVGALATGIAVVLFDETNNEVVHNFTPHRIQSIHDWSLYAGVDSINRDAALTDAYIARWTFTRAGSGKVRVDGSLGHVLRVEIPDALDALDSQVIMAQGHKQLV